MMLTTYFSMLEHMWGADMDTSFLQCFHKKGEGFWLLLPPRFTTPDGPVDPETGKRTRRFWPASKYCLFTRRYVYGLDVSSRALYKVLRHILESMGFDTSSHDSCLFWRLDGEGWALIIIFVDDFTFSATSSAIAEEIKTALKDKAKLWINFEHHPQRVVGWNLTYHSNNDALSLDTLYYERALVELYEEEMLKLYGRIALNEKRVPGNPAVSDLTLQLEGLKEPASKADQTEARTFSGQMLYVSAKNGADVASQTNRLCRSQPSALWKKEKLWTLQYLRYRIRIGTRITYYRRRTDQPLIPTVSLFTDSGSRDKDGRMLLGYVILLNGTVVGYRSSMTKVPCTSISAGEVYACCDGVKELLFLMMMVSEMGINLTEGGGAPVGIDNFGALRYGHGSAKNLRHLSHRTKFVEHVASGKMISLHQCPTKINIADPLSKVMSSNQTNVKFMRLILDTGYLLDGYKNERLKESLYPKQRS